MRPRHKAAENRDRPGPPLQVRAASMRPRHKAAENRAARADQDAVGAASMRPRHKAAENRRCRRTAWRWRRGCFNEAAA